MNARFALGLYTVYEELNRDMEDTLHAVGEMGYDGVEFYGEPVWDPDKIKKVLFSSNLQLCGWHTEWSHLQPDTINDTIAYHKAVGTPNLIVPALGGPWEIAHTREEDCAGIWVKHAKALNHLSVIAGRHGMNIGYHTHAHEFNTFFDGVTPWDILCEYTIPEVLLELDTGNCLEGGADPVKVLARIAQRVSFLHFKPYSSRRQFDIILGDEDDLNDWVGIVSESRKGSTEWYIVESEVGNMGPKLNVAEVCLKRLREIILTNIRTII